MRLFATDRVMKMLDTFGLKEGEVIEHKMVNNAIEKAQKRVEENNFGIRKRLLEYDDVMNKQRSYIYARRHHALIGERVGIDIANMLYDCIENLVKSYDGPNDYADLQLELYRALTLEMPVTEEEYRSLDTEDRIERLHDAAIKALDRRSERIREVAWPVIARIVEANEYTGKIIVPVTDGKRLFNLRIDLQQAYDSQCRNIVKEWHKAILLVTIDELWKEHLRELDQLRQSVQNASYEQKDPLVIYKVESFHLFEGMLNQLNLKTLSALMRGQIPVRAMLFISATAVFVLFAAAAGAWVIASDARTCVAHGDRCLRRSLSCGCRAALCFLSGFARDKAPSSRDKPTIIRKCAASSTACAGIHRQT